MQGLRTPVTRDYDEDVKRALTVSVRVTPEDLAKFQEAAKQLWPADAQPTNSTLLLVLARREAERILKPGKKK